MKKILSILTTAVVLSTIASSQLKAQTALSAGDLMFTGIQANGTTDNISFVTFRELTAGTTVYFTDNGWTGSAFRNSTSIDFDGSEGLVFFKVKADQSVAAGTIIRLLDTNTSKLDWFSVSGSTATFNTPGTIGTGNATSPQFPFLSFSQSGDQVYGFQSSLSAISGTSGSNPLFATSSQTSLLAINTSTTWVNSTSTTTGAITPGLSESNGTAFKINSGTTAAPTTLATGAFFNTQLFATATEQEWKDAIKNSANWTVTASGDTGASVLPTGTLSLVPEPSSAALLGIGMVALVAVRALRRGRSDS